MRGLTAGAWLRQTRTVTLRAFGLAALLVVMMLSLWATTALAEGALTAEQEKTARSMEAKLIAPCCWTSPVADHQSEAADQLKSEIRMLLSQGKSEKDIIDGIVGRYGDKILAAPAARGFNLTAYLLPALGIIVAGFIVVFMSLRWRREPSEPVAVAVKAESDPIDDPYQDRLREDLKSFDD